VSLAKEARWVAIARLGRAWGIRGELAALSLTSKPERFQKLREVFLFRDGQAAEPVRLRVESVREHLRGWLFKFRGVDTMSQAELLERSEVRIPLEQRLALEQSEHYLSDLMGCEVRDRATGDLLGMVTGWEDAGGAGVLEVGGSLLIPFARSICVDIDTRAKRILVNLPDGLKDLNRP
jgi:16S rRNA processing protein RimM